MTTEGTAHPAQNQRHHYQSVFRPGLFRSKIALVSGGGTGIGRCIASELATLGATVVIASRDETMCRQAADEINQSIRNAPLRGQVVAGPPTSIRSEQEIENLISYIVNTYGSLDLLVNNAGGQFICATEDMSKKGFAAVVDTNLQGTFLMCREAYTQYMRDNGGSIVNITIGNRNGMPGMVHSAAARAGVENMTATLCTEWIESNVRINCVRPGIIWTESGFKNYGPAGDVFIERILPSLPSKRFGSPEEVSSAALWLLSEGASYVTGTVVCVDGGSSYTFLPLIDIDDSEHLPVYGTLPRKARL
jgi:peroxisomal trans-2-enoyl-CoA reductase